MPVKMKRTMGDVLSVENSKSEYRARLDERRRKSEALERDKLALKGREIDVDAGIRNRLAGIQERQVGLEGRRVGELEKTGETERGLATRQEDRLSGEQSFTQGLRERKLALDIGKTFKGGEATNQLMSGDMTFFDSANLETRPTGQPRQSTFKDVPPVLDEDGNVVREGFVFDTSSAAGHPSYKPPPNPIDAAKEEFRQKKEQFGSAMKSPYVPKLLSRTSMTTAERAKSAVKSGSVDDILKKGNTKKNTTSASKTGDKKVSATEQRDKAILNRLKKKRGQGKMTVAELDQLNNLSKQYA